MRTSLAILAAAAALLVVARLVHAPSPHPAAPQAGVSDSGSVHLNVPREHDRGTARTRTTPRSAARTARLFMAGYLRWQRGRRDPLTVAMLRHAASPELWRDLTSGA